MSSARELVLAIEPTAMLYRVTFFYKKILVHRPSHPLGMCIGIGFTELGAWRHAARNLGAQP